MSQTGRFELKTWLENADEALHASKVIEMQFLMERRHGGHISMFLLHYAIELYLKAFLMDKSAKFRFSHDLEYLFNYSVGTSGKLV
jgi:HEPN domain-containing protein